jgi:flagellar hook-associated protein 3 FlgL
MDVIGLALSGTTLQAKVSETNAWAIENAINISIDTTSTVAQKEAAIKTAKEGVGSRAGAYIQKAIDYGILEKKATNAIDKDQATADKKQALIDADLGQYGDWIESAKSRVEVTLDNRGQMVVKDKKNSDTPMQLSLEERHAYATPELENPPASTITQPRSALSFMANDAIKIQDPSIDFFQDLDSIIKSVRRGEFQLSADNENPRSLGMNYAIDQITHILDHVTKEHTTIGAYSNALSDASDRAEFLSLNVKTVRSQIIDVDIAEAYLQFNQISTSYQAMLSTISKINSMSLLNYM